jgi:hypothetical protein
VPGNPGEPLRRPEPARKGGADVDYCSVRKAGRRRRREQSAFKRVGVDPVPLQQPRPALPFVHVLDPFGAVAETSAVLHDMTGADGLQEFAALRAFAMEVYGNVHVAGADGKRIIQAGHW